MRYSGRTAIRVLAVAATVFCAATAVPRAAAADQPRHLVYAFSTYDTARVALGAMGVDGPGTGRLTVDILPGDAGRRIVTVQEWWWHEPRPEQARTCTVIPLGSIVCGLYPMPSEAENVLLPMLAEDYASGLKDNENQEAWGTNVYGGNYGVGWIVIKTQSVATVLDRSSKNKLLWLRVNDSNRQTNANYISYATTSSVTYDQLEQAPLSLHAEVVSTPLGTVFTSTSVDLKLLSPIRPFEPELKIEIRS
jgi:hypothetical protein